jgi:hypothetical protein
MALVTACLAISLYLAAQHSVYAEDIAAADHSNLVSSNTAEPIPAAPKYAPGAQSFDIKATATTYAPTFKKYLYSFALPQPAINIVGIDGYVSITSAMPRFSEALISAHYSPSGHCPSDGAVYDTYDQIGLDFPGTQPLAQFVLKLPTSGTTQVPTQLALPVPIPVRGCIFVILDGGVAGAGGRFTMTSGMSLAYTPPQPYSAATILGLGDEFCLGQSWGCQLASTNTSERTAFAKAIKIAQPSTLRALYGGISDSALGPAGYAAPPTGFWMTWNDFYLYKGCTIPEGTTGPADYYASIPADAVHLLNVTLQGTDDAAVQQMVYKSFNVPLSTGDCLVHLFKGTPNGGMSAEAQVLALIQPNTAPIGNLDDVTSSGLVSGWVLDPDTPTTPRSVQFYLDGPSGRGSLIGLALANMSRPDVNQVTGYPGDHGFAFQLPSSIANGNHTIYAYGIDSAAGPNSLLSGAPKTVTIAINKGGETAQ